MYLSKVTLKPSHKMADALLMLDRNGVYSSHQLLWQLFSRESERQFIYRQDIGHGGLPVFLVLSHCEPDYQSELFHVQTKVFDPKLDQGQRLAFKLRVNPTICISDVNGRSKRHDVLMHAKKLAKHEGLSGIDLKHHMEQAAHRWICDEKRLETWGIQLNSLPEIEAYTQHRSKKRTGRKVQFSSVDFQGVLTISDPLAFLAQYAKGFGRAKGLGCGLMLIRAV